MSRLLRKLQERNRRRIAGGSLASLSGLGSLGDTASTITSVADIAAEVGTDPYFAEMLCHVKQLSQIQKGQPVETCVELPVFGGPESPIGLKYAAIPARAYVFGRQHPLAWILGGMAVLAIPILTGYVIGRSTRGS